MLGVSVHKECDVHNMCVCRCGVGVYGNLISNIATDIMLNYAVKTNYWCQISVLYGPQMQSEVYLVYIKFKKGI